MSPAEKANLAAVTAIAEKHGGEPYGDSGRTWMFPFGAQARRFAMDCESQRLHFWQYIDMGGVPDIEIWGRPGVNNY